jgi:citrate lyase subunit beta/citryl-CoA lyase
MRSYLFVPGNAPERFVSAAGLGADVVVIDLADAIAPEAKDEARAKLHEWLRTGPQTPVWVRINAGELGHLDVHAIVGPAVSGVCVAGSASASQLAALATVLAEVEEAQRMPIGSVAVSPVLETAAAVLSAAEIARVPRVSRLQLSETALRAQLGVEVGPDERELWWARSMVVLASAAAGIEAPVAPVSVGDVSPDELRASTEALRRMGFRGRACVDPEQIAVVNDVFSNGRY